MEPFIPNKEKFAKYTRITFLCSAITLSVFNNAFGQKANSDFALPALVSIIPPSPTAAALGRFGEIPVGLYTGLPSITIPLYTAKNSSGTGVVPVTLNYHATGIRVDDMGSWVGLGWSLDCGGVVTRTIHGLPDESPLGYLHQGGQMMDRYLNGTATTTEQLATERDGAQERKDFEPDVYSFNFAGHSGQFVLDRSGKPALLPQQPLLIEARTDTSGFKITAEDGTVYQFLVPESTTTVTTPNRMAPESYESSWYLARVEPIVGHSIKFVYTNPAEITYQAGNNDSKQVTVMVEESSGASNAGFIKELPQRTEIKTSAVTLKQIRFANQNINFYASQRADVLNVFKLDSFVVTNIQAEVVKRYKFSYKQQGRTFLSEIQEGYTINARTGIPPYRFTYNEANILPAPYSKSQDHWGYFNSNSAPTLIPTTTLFIQYLNPASASYNLVIPGATREPDSVRMKAGILTKIEYPTGGYSSFDYETHDYSSVGKDDVPITPVVAVGGASVRVSPSVGDNAAEFYLFSEQTVDFKTDIDNGGDTRTDRYADIALSYTCITCNQQVKQGLVPISETLYGTKTFAIKLPKGRYRINASYEQLRANGAGYGYISAIFQDSIGFSGKKLSGGLRIRRITTKANASDPELVKSYKYRLSNNITRSSGCAVSDVPTYKYYFTNYQSPSSTQSGVTVIYHYCMLTPNSRVQLGMTQGALVGYSEVAEIVGKQGEGGKTIHTFTTAKNYPDIVDGSEFPFAPNTGFDYKRGKPLQTNIYKYESGLYKPVTNIRYTYSLNSARTQRLSQQVHGLKFGCTASYQGNQDGINDDYISQHYYYKSEWIYPTSQTTRQYGPTGDTTIYQLTQTRYRYENSMHQQLTVQEQTTSNGGITVRKYKYPLDFQLPSGVRLDESSAAIKTLADRHVLEVSLEQQNWRRVGSDSILLGARLTQYTGIYPKRIWQLNAATPIQPANFYSASIQPDGVFRQDARYQNMIAFERYDADGNLLQQRQNFGPPTSYLWGYSNTLPIAEIKNASYSEVQQQLRIIGSGSTSSMTDMQIRDVIIKLRQRLPSAQIVGFTHRPLIGLASQTDPTGRIITHEYDGLGRLIRTRDEQGRILSQQQYHYAGK